ncbi:MAG: exonuclease SbcCD subunit D [Bacteroidales bacterium]|nr:exonuclease SbcCD subunit D [Bacteroidales bacterium]
MTKIICTSDWHLGNIFHKMDRLPEQQHFLDWLEQTIVDVRPDALLVAGDVFDTSNPSAAAQSLYYDFLDRATSLLPSMQIIITGGNHDSGNRLEAPRLLLARHKVEVRGSVQRQRIATDDGYRTSLLYDDLIIPVTAADGTTQAAVVALPYLRPDQLPGSSYSAGVRQVLQDSCTRARSLYPEVPVVMMAHIYTSGAEIANGSSERIVGGQEQVDFGPWPDHPDYLTCGHIHKRQPIAGTSWARYSGSTLPMSFAERDYRHGVDLLLLEQGMPPRIEFIEYEVQHPLVSLPRQGGADIDTLLKLIAELPDRQGNTLSDRCLYLELNLTADVVDDNTIQRMEAAVARKDAVICRECRIMPDIDVPSFNGGERFASMDDVLNRDPLDALIECFELKNGKGSLGERRTAMLRELVNSINGTSSETAKEGGAI